MQIKFDGEWLRYLIRMRGLSQTELAARMNVAGQTVSNFVNGRTVPSWPMLARLFVALDMSLDEARCAFIELFNVVEVNDE